MATLRRKKPSFGQAIVSLRKERGLNQKDLAARLRREDASGTISAQYLNDIEHDRRSPSSDHLISELSKALGVDAAFLSFLAGQLPREIRDLPLDERRLREAVQAFQRAADKAK